jgi:[ribosomal protein S5]-alanine N-acetyltransferase
VPRPERALEVGAHVYLRPPTPRDRQAIVALNRASRAFHRGWVAPPTDPAAFALWMTRSRQPNVACFLVCRVADDAIAGVFVLSEIVRGKFQSAYLGYYAGRVHAGQS